MASVSDEQQVKGNLGGPDLFLAPIGRLDANKITKHFCNTCEKEFEGSPKIEFENPNEEGEVGSAKPLDANVTTAPTVEATTAPTVEATTAPTVEATTAPTVEATQPGSAASVSSIEGRMVIDENANKVGTAKQVGIDANTQSMVLVIIKNDGTEGSIPWVAIKKVGEVVLLGKPEESAAAQPGKCSECGFVNKDGSKFCEECGTKI